MGDGIVLTERQQDALEGDKFLGAHIVGVDGDCPRVRWPDGNEARLEPDGHVFQIEDLGRLDSDVGGGRRLPRPNLDVVEGDLERMRY